jgi:transcriptional regulator GlxA family with amidase domain
MFEPDSSPIDIEILVVPDSTLLLVSAVLEPLRAANRILGSRHYRWIISTPDGLPAMTTSGIPIPADRAFDAAASAMPLIVVASYNLHVQMTRDLVRRIGAARRYRPVIGGVETGVFLLAEAGLLNGSAASVHWEDREDFAARYPDVELRNDRFVIDSRRFTAGAATPTLDMMLHLIRLRLGYTLALNVSKSFIYDPSREANMQPSLGRFIEGDERVARAVGIMDAHLEHPLSIAEIARRAGISARHLQTLFVDALNTLPKDYYRALRLSQARRHIIESRRPLRDIAVTAGFSHMDVFTRAYAKIYEETPSQTRKRLSAKASAIL